MTMSITIAIDLSTVSPFRIDGVVLVTLPADGPLEAVTTHFQTVTKQSLRLVLAARRKEAIRLEQEEAQAITRWQEARGYTPLMVQDQLNLEAEENNGET